MTLLPPFLPQSIRYGQNAFPDVEPFSLRAAASYEDIQYSIVTWIRDQLMPWILDNSAGTTWAVAAQTLTDSVNAALAAEAATFASQYGTFFMGAVVAPPATGVTATDTANLVAAITTAQGRHADLILTPSSDGTHRTYSLSSALTWDLNKGSLLAQGHVILDFSQVTSSFQGPAFTVSANADTSEGSHLSATHRVAGFTMVGHDLDSSLMDGIQITQGTGTIGNDQGTLREVQVLKFRDNLTFGANTWDFEFHKCAFAKAHRYCVNLSGGTGESQQFVDCDIYGASNANGTAANLFSPAGQSVDARFYGGSFDYPGGGGNGSIGGTPGTGGIQGIIQGGCVTFDTVHFEDGNANPMFTYALNSASTWIDVTFKDCYWSSTIGSTGTRDHLHEILASTRDSITLRFQNDKGAANANTQRWIVNNSGITTDGISVTYDGWNVVNNQGLTLPTALLLSPFQTLGSNMRFDTANTFVTGGVNGWTAGTVDTWTISSANARNGNALQLVGTGAGGTNSTYQQFRIPATRKPLRIAGYQQVTAYTAGSVGLYARFYAEDGATQLGSDYRLGTDLAAAAGWTGKVRRIIPPAGSAFCRVMAVAASFQGTAQWDDIEVVPL